jgi:hypothetical protein
VAIEAELSARWRSQAAGDGTPHRRSDRPNIPRKSKELAEKFILILKQSCKADRDRTC